MPVTDPPTTTTRTQRRANWCNQWLRYTSRALGRHPQSNRKQRRTYWREEWQQREPGEFGN